jgi:hypothetical protein
MSQAGREREVCAWMCECFCFRSCNHGVKYEDHKVCGTRAERCYTGRRPCVFNSAMQRMARASLTGMVEDVRTSTKLFLSTRGKTRLSLLLEHHPSLQEV